MPERWKVARERAHHVCKPAVMPAAPKLAKVGQKFKGLRGAKTRVRRDNAPICRRNANLCTPHANFGTPHAKKLSEASAYGVVIEKNVTDLRAELHAAAA